MFLLLISSVCETKTLTRAAILDAFTPLREDHRIIKAEDPAIIIYFAGHGARVDKPELEERRDWEFNTGQIECWSLRI